MCLAVPAMVMEREGDEAWVLLGETRLRVSLVLEPEVETGDYVLVHAGFAIQRLTEEEARETFTILERSGVIEAEDAP